MLYAFSRDDDRSISVRLKWAYNIGKLRATYNCVFNILGSFVILVLLIGLSSSLFGRVSHNIEEGK